MMDISQYNSISFLIFLTIRTFYGTIDFIREVFFMYGSYCVQVDNKFRIYLPAAFRKEIKNADLILTLFDSENVTICSSDGWSPSNFVDVLNNNLSEVEKVKLATFIKLNSVSLNLDVQGRIQFPKQFRSQLNFNDSVVVTGEGNYLSVMSKTLYNSYIENLSRDVNRMLVEDKFTLVNKSRF